MARFKWDNLILFVEQLAAAASLKLPIGQAVYNMSRESLDSDWRKAQESVSELVNLGSPLSEAMSNYPKFFPETLRRLVRAGEEGNVLAPMLASAGRYLQTALEVQNRLRKCLIYPMLVWAFLMFDFFLLLIFVMPKFAQMYDGMGASLPTLTAAFTSAGPIFMVLGLGLLFFFGWLMIGFVGAEADVESKGAYFARLAPYVPFWGSLQRHARAAQVCEILGILIRGGNNGHQAIAIARQSISHPLVAQSLEDIQAAIGAGDYDTSPYRSGLIPHTTLWMMAERPDAADMGATFQRLAEYHRRQFEVQASIVQDILGPFLLLVVAIIGGLGIVSVFYPILNIANVVTIFGV